MAQRSFLDRCFKNPEGRIVIIQLPNVPLIIFLVLDIAASSPPLRHHKLASNLLTLASIPALGFWAWGETTKGVNYFRRALGIFGIGICVMMAIGLIQKL